jgi:hypothetical protein
MATKIEIKNLPEHGLFLHRNQVWRSMGKLIVTSHSITAQRVVLNKEGIELNNENADFIETLLVTPYLGEVPKTSEYTGRYERSWYQYCLDKLK